MRQLGVVADWCPDQQSAAASPGHESLPGLGRSRVWFWNAGTFARAWSVLLGFRLLRLRLLTWLRRRRGALRHLQTKRDGDYQLGTGGNKGEASCIRHS